MRNVHERLNNEDEIDLVELVQGVWRHKIWVLIVAAPITVMGVLYAQLATPVYEAKLYVQPPPQNDISQLNYGRGGSTGLGVLAVRDVYDIYLRSLQSEAVRNKFFRSVYLPTLSEEERKQSRDGLYGEFNTVMKVGLVSKDTPNRYVITAHAADPQQAAAWVNTFAEMSADAAKHEVLESSRSEMLVKADNLEQEIIGAKSSTGKEREDRVAQLKEALVIAKSIGLEKPPLISGTLSTEVSAGMDGSLTYMRGSKALESEIANLETRESDDPFVRGLREKEEAVRFYRNVKLNPALISVYKQDGVVDLPDKPIKPRKAIIMVFTAVIGVGLGLAVAIAREVWCRRVRRHIS